MECSALPTVEFDRDTVASLLEKRDSTRTLLVYVDRISDPHNMGAIARSAFFFGARALIVGDGCAPASSGVVSHISAGAIEALNVFDGRPQTLLALARDFTPRLSLFAASLPRDDDDVVDRLEHVKPTDCNVLVLGSEGKGVRRSLQFVSFFFVVVLIFLDLTQQLKSLPCRPLKRVALRYVAARRTARSARRSIRSTSASPPALCCIISEH